MKFKEMITESFVYKGVQNFTGFHPRWTNDYPEDSNDPNKKYVVLVDAIGQEKYPHTGNPVINNSTIAISLEKAKKLLLDPHNLNLDIRKIAEKTNRSIEDIEKDFI